MFEDEFAEMLQNYPEAVSDKKVFSGLMRDLFPGQQREIHLLSTAFDLDIAKEIAGAASIDNTFAYRFVKQLMEDYGVSRVHADWAAAVWCVCYGSKILHKPCSITLNQGGIKGVPHIQPKEQTAEKTYDALFSYLKIPGGYGITGFSGSNKQIMIFSGQYNRLPVKRIMPRSFAECNVQEMIMVDGIEEIGEGAFQGCTKLKQVIFPNTLKKIGDKAFDVCPSLVTAALPFSLEEIGAYAFSGTGLKAVFIPQTVSRLGEGVFSSCCQLKNAVLPDHLTAIPHRLFSRCENLAEIELPETITSIGESAFEGCHALQYLTIPPSVQHIGRDAFSGMNPKFTLLCPPFSEAERYARSCHMTFQFVD